MRSRVLIEGEVQVSKDDLSDHEVVGLYDPELVREAGALNELS